MLRGSRWDDRLVSKRNRISRVRKKVRVPRVLTRMNLQICLIKEKLLKRKQLNLKNVVKIKQNLLLQIKQRLSRIVMQITNKKKKLLMHLLVEKLQMIWLFKTYLSRIMVKLKELTLVKLRIRFPIVLGILLVDLVRNWRKEDRKLGRPKRQKKRQQRIRQLIRWVQIRKEVKRKKLRRSKKWNQRIKHKQKLREKKKKKLNLKLKLLKKILNNQKRRRVQPKVLELKRMPRKTFIAKWNHGRKI